MKSPSAADLATAQRLLAREGGDDEHPAASAARAYQKLHDHLAPLIGAAGVRALFFRSQKMARLAGFVFLEGGAAGAADPAASAGKQLHDSLLDQNPAQAAEAAAVVFATFFGLLTTFIGDRLTRQVLRGAWPETAKIAPAETKK